MKSLFNRSVCIITILIFAGVLFGACSFPDGDSTPTMDSDVLATMVAQTLTAQPPAATVEQATQSPDEATAPPVEPATDTLLPEVTEPQDDIQSEGQGVTLGEPNCFDLDGGQIAGSGDTHCDFTVRKGPDGDYTLTMFIPILPARFGFSGVFPQEPDREKCASSPDLSSDTEVISPLGSLYVCYQTNEGRYGYLYFSEVSSDGVTFNWRTYNPPAQVPTPVPTLTPSDDPDIPTTDPDWIDTFDSDANWTTYSDDSVIFEIRDGRAYMIAPQANNTFRFMLSFPDLDDFYLQSYFKTASACTGKDRYGLVVRTNKDSGAYVNYYIFGISCDGSYYLSVSDSNGQTLLVDWTPDAAIKAGPDKVNLIAIRMEGDRIVLFANDQRLAEVNDSTWFYTMMLTD